MQRFYQRVRREISECHVVHRVIFLTIVCLDIILFCMIFAHLTKKPTFKDQSSFVIDAGSVHTTVTKYSWPGNAYVNGTALVEEVDSCEIDSSVGISSLEPEEVDEYLFKDTNCSKRMWGPNSYDKTKHSNDTYLCATAGMRDLRETNRTKAEQIMAVIEKKLPNHTKILTSDDEGIYGWLSVNYAEYGSDLDPFSGTQVGALDWGGSSTQVSFAAPTSDKIVSVFGKNISVFTRSDACYGQHEALKRYFYTILVDKFDEENGMLNFTAHIEVPCQPKSEGNVEFEKSELFDTECIDLELHPQLKSAMDDYEGTISFYGSSNLTACRERVDVLFHEKTCRRYFGNGSCFSRPAVDDWAEKPRKFFAFSTFWHTTGRLGVDIESTSRRGLLAKSNRLDDKLEQLCSVAVQDHPLQKLDISLEARTEAINNECFRSTFMRALLVDGYGFTESTVIVPVDKIGGQTIGWSLGYLLVQTAESKIPPPGFKYLSSSLYFAASFAGIFVVLILWCVTHFCCKRNNPYPERI